MFTGIIQEMGSVEARTQIGAGVRLRVRAPASARELAVGQSIALNGTCLTVVGRNGSSFELEAVEETLKKTTLGSCEAGDRVNLELPMRLDGRLDGHLVTGHVDAVGEILEIEILETSRLFTLRIPAEFGRYCVETGSIAVDGVSLTIARLAGGRVGISIIPHTSSTLCSRTTRSSIRSILSSMSLGSTWNESFIPPIRKARARIAPARKAPICRHPDPGSPQRSASASTGFR